MDDLLLGCTKVWATCQAGLSSRLLHKEGRKARQTGAVDCGGWKQQERAEIAGSFPWERLGSRWIVPLAVGHRCGGFLCTRGGRSVCR